MLAETIFVMLFLVSVYLLRDAIRVTLTPEFRSDVKRLREQRRNRKAARRN